MPEDLLLQIKKYITTHNETYDINKVFFYIDCTVDPPKLVFDKWLYPFPSPVVVEGVLSPPNNFPPKNESPH